MQLGLAWSLDFFSEATVPVLACRWSSGQSSRTGPELRPASSSQHATRPIAASREKVAHVSQPASGRSTMLTFGGTVEHHFDNKNRTGQSTRQRLSSSSSWPPCNEPQTFCPTPNPKALEHLGTASTLPRSGLAELPRSLGRSWHLFLL